MRSNLALVTTDAAERERLVIERVTILRERLGDEHPLTLNARIAVAFAIPDDDRARESLKPACETYARMHPAHGAAIVECASELIWLQLATGDSAGARASAALALAASPDRVDVERVHLMRGYAALLDGKPAAARERLDAVAARILPASDTKWWQLLFAAEVDLARALVARAEGKPPHAILERARGYLERAAAAKPLPTITRRLEWLRRATE